MDIKTSFWVLANKLTFGSLSRFYSGLASESIKNDIAKSYSLMVNGNALPDIRLTSHKLQQFMQIMTNFRNVCAHDERFYNHTTPHVRGFDGTPAKVSDLARIMIRMLSFSNGEVFGNELMKRLKSFHDSCPVNEVMHKAIIFETGLLDGIENEIALIEKARSKK